MQTCRSTNIAHNVVAHMACSASFATLMLVRTGDAYIASNCAEDFKFARSRPIAAHQAVKKGSAFHFWPNDGKASEGMHWGT